MQTLKWFTCKLKIQKSQMFKCELKTHSFLETTFDKHCLPKSSSFTDFIFYTHKQTVMYCPFFSLKRLYSDSAQIKGEKDYENQKTVNSYTLTCTFHFFLDYSISVASQTISFLSYCVSVQKRNHQHTLSHTSTLN